MLHRPDYYDESDRPGEAELILAKNRDGRTCGLPLVWRGSQKRYESFARESTNE